MWASVQQYASLREGEELNGGEDTHKLGIHLFPLHIFRSSLRQNLRHRFVQTFRGCRLYQTFTCADCKIRNIDSVAIPRGGTKDKMVAPLERKKKHLDGDGVRAVI